MTPLAKQRLQDLAKELERAGLIDSCWRVTRHLESIGNEPKRYGDFYLVVDLVPAQQIHRASLAITEGDLKWVARRPPQDYPLLIATWETRDNSSYYRARKLLMTWFLQHGITLPHHPFAASATLHTEQEDLE